MNDLDTMNTILDKNGSKIINNKSKVHLEKKTNPNMPESNITTQDIKKDSQKLANSLSLFVRKTANDWIEEAKKRPIPRMLFGELWFEGELCMMFADTGLGKSILAVQISDSIAKGEAIPPFKLEAPPQPVLYFDFELSDKQFETRYSTDYKNHYQFNANFNRLEISRNFEIPEGATFEYLVTTHMEWQINLTGAKILIIDNLTFLSHDTEKAKDALVLMKHLKRLKNKYDLSILVLGHTPKIESHKPITKNHLAGSKMLINFFDSAFAIGESYRSKDTRYLKQIKERNCEKIYHSENVPILMIDKSNSFLHFQFIELASEKEHLKPLEKEEKEVLRDKVEELHNSGYSIRKIATELRGQISKSAIHRIINEEILPR